MLGLQPPAVPRRRALSSPRDHKDRCIARRHPKSEAPTAEGLLGLVEYAVSA